MVEQVRSGTTLDNMAEEINIDAERSLWLLVTFDLKARELTVSMLVARVHKAHEESKEMKVNACGCLARIEAARREEINTRVAPLMTRIISASLNLLENFSDDRIAEIKTALHESAMD